MTRAPGTAARNASTMSLISCFLYLAGLSTIIILGGTVAGMCQPPGRAETGDDMRAHLRIPPARALTAAALGLAAAALTGALAGPALAASPPAGPAHTAGRPLPAPLRQHALRMARSGDSAPAATLTET